VVIASQRFFTICSLEGTRKSKVTANEWQTYDDDDDDVNIRCETKI